MPQGAVARARANARFRPWNTERPPVVPAAYSIRMSGDALSDRTREREERPAGPIAIEVLVRYPALVRLNMYSKRQPDGLERSCPVAVGRGHLTDRREDLVGQLRPVLI